MLKKILSSLLCSAFITLQSMAVAADTCQEILGETPSDCVPIKHWNISLALGVGTRTNPLVNGKAIPLIVIPQLSYYGKRFFISNLDLGYTLYERSASSVSLVASPTYDRVFFYRTDLQNIFSPGGTSGAGGVTDITTDPGAGSGSASVGSGSSSTTAGSEEVNTSEAVSDAEVAQLLARSRRVAYLVGPEWTFRFQQITGQLDLLHDVTRVHNGSEVRLAFSVPLESREHWVASAGVTWKSAALVTYYYGAENIYELGSSLSQFIKLRYAFPLTQRWQFKALAHYEKLGRSIANSPIVSKNYVTTAFVGAAYQF